MSKTKDKRELGLAELATLERLSVQLSTVARSIRLFASYLTVEDFKLADVAVHRASDAIVDIRRASMPTIVTARNPRKVRRAGAER